jgi:mannose-6-phosphate isomerase-like protein (cupin superfamily)
VTKDFTPSEEAMDFAIGGLAPEVIKAIAERRRSNPKLDADISLLEQSLAPLLVADDEQNPSSNVWAAIKAEIGDATTHVDLPIAERRADGEWLETAQGVKSKLIWGGLGRLIQCTPEGVLTPHDHAREEYSIIMEGDLIIDNVVYLAGDTVQMRVGTHHNIATTRTGCLVLISYAS